MVSEILLVQLIGGVTTSLLVIVLLGQWRTYLATKQNTRILLGENFDRTDEGPDGLGRTVRKHDEQLSRHEKALKANNVLPADNKPEQK